MFVAMNRFQIVSGKESQFEAVWNNRKSNLQDVPGFKSFNLLRGSSNDDYTLYATHVIWESEESFKDWTTSEHFRKSHARAGGTQELYLGPPHFEGFSSVLDK